MGTRFTHAEENLRKKVEQEKFTVCSVHSENIVAMDKKKILWPGFNMWVCLDIVKRGERPGE
jgi:hypothetical protein